MSSKSAASANEPKTTESKVLFEKILVAVDGSKYGQYATDFGFLLTEKVGRALAFQHVVDVRMADLFIEPEFASELGLSQSNETTDKVMKTLNKMGKLVLHLVSEEAKRRDRSIKTFCDEGYVLYEVMRRAGDYNLLVVGHRGRGEGKRPSTLAIGSVAERVTLASKIPVLIASKNPKSLDGITVAYDGSEASIGALLMSEQLAKSLALPLRAIHVTESANTAAEARYVVEQGQKYLREKWDMPVFSVEVGVPADVILVQTADTNNLLVLGAYGFRSADSLVMGTTATHVIRRAQNNLLIYR